MYSENFVSLIGNVGRAEVKESNGTKFATLSIATNERWADKATGEVKEKTEWHRAVSFRPQMVSLIEKHVGKGDFVRLTGKLHTRSFLTDGETHYSTEIHIDRLGFLSPKSVLETQQDDGEE